MSSVMWYSYLIYIVQLSDFSNDNNDQSYAGYKAVKHLQHFSVMKCLPWYMNRWNVAGMKDHLDKKYYHDREHM